MIFFLVFILIMFGLILSGLFSLMPLSVLITVPPAIRMMFFFVGVMITIVGLLMLHGRAYKTGAIHLLNFGKPGTIIWFYVYRDGTVKITPAMREVEGTLYSQELDAQIQDFKSYRLFDHSIRFVPEGIGHAVDLDMVLYSMMLKNKFGYQNIREARESVFINLLKKLRLPMPDASMEITQPERLATDEALWDIDQMRRYDSQALKKRDINGQVEG